MSQRKLPLTGLPVGAVSPAVLVCGDPGRAARMAAHLQDAQLLSDQREYRAYQGQYQGVVITVCSHGIGAPGAAIAFEELIEAGARQMIRVGTCGGLQPHLEPGHLVVATAAVQRIGYAAEVAPPGYPAVADLSLTQALIQTAILGGHSCTNGLILTRDAFYPGVKTSHTPDYATLSAANVLATEMECAPLFIVGSLRAVPTAAILAVDGNVLAHGESIDEYNPHRPVVAEAVDKAIQIALQTLISQAQPPAARPMPATMVLLETDVDPDPVVQFGRWFDDTQRAHLPEPTAMTLATATPDGRPSARLVLLKGFDQEGFVFFTNYDSRKGQELWANSWAALVFWWPELSRQVRIEGRVEPVSAAESDAYFQTRPRGSQLGAWASHQSQVINGREGLDERVAELVARYEGQMVPRPPYWGGYRLRPVEVEFWQGRPNRLHDRLRYRRDDQGEWLIERLSP